MNALKNWGGLLICLALLLCVGVCQAETAQDVTSECKIKTSEGKSHHFLDDRISSSWSYSQPNATISISLPDEVVPGALVIKWDFDPTGYTIEEFDADGQLLATRDESCTFPKINDYYPLNERTRRILLTMTAAKQEIHTLRVYSAGEPKADTQIWDDQLTKSDLMVVSTHQDDELIFFGGVIPYYNLAEGRPTQVVYMANCARSRREEALKGLWIMGVRTYPEFINLRDERIKSYEQTLANWGGADSVIEQLVERIRRFRPEVIVTHDLDGEYGHNQHKVTARLMQEAIEAAADPARYPNSAYLYGVWQTKKLYLHLYAENRVYLDWNTPYEQLGGLTPLQSAQLGYSQHVSQHKYYQVSAGGKYDNSIFGLAYSTVGPDTEGKNDLFEHLSERPIQPTPVETPLPQSADASAQSGELSTGASAAQSIDAANSSAAQPTRKKHSGWKWVLGIGLAGATCAAALRQRQINRQRERERRRRAAMRARRLAHQYRG